MASILKNFLGWSVIPDFATKNGLFMTHRYIFPSLGLKVPPQNTEEYRRQYRYAYAVVVLGYLFYTLVDGARSMEYNYYEILGVPPDVDENGLKIAFRHFARKYHPDRPGVGSAGAELFMKVRDAFEALKNPTVRFAYDRFGPDVLQWTKLSTTREYMRQGLMQSSGYHIFTGISLGVISNIGRPSPVSFWRFLLFFSFFALELAFILYPTPSASTVTTVFADPAADLSFKTIFHVLFPYRVPYQHIRFLHQVFMFLSIALTRVAPRLFPDDPRSEYELVLQHIEAMSGFADREASMMLHTELHSIHPFTPTTRVSTTELHPCNPSSDIMDSLAKEMENMIIETNLKKDIGPLRSAREEAIETGRRVASERITTRNPLSGTPTLLKPVATQIEADGNLPSPRPSPPPPIGLVRRGSSFVRARSYSHSLRSLYVGPMGENRDDFALSKVHLRFSPETHVPSFLPMTRNTHLHIMFFKPKWNPTGLHVYIPGGSTGLGLAVSILMVQKGAHVSIVARNQANLDKAIAVLAEHRVFPEQRLAAYSFDLSTGSGSVKALEAVCEPYEGRAPDAVLALAGMGRPKFFVEMTEEDLVQGMNGAYWVQAWTAWAAAKMMVRQHRKGKIALVSSTLGFMSFVGHASYSPGKHALRALADTLQSEFMLYDIDVHIFFPPTMVTESWLEELKTKPALTHEIEGPDAGVSVDYAALTLYKGIRNGHHHIAADWITKLFSSSTRGAAPRTYTLMDICLDITAWVAIPVWRIMVDRKVRKHREQHQKHLEAIGFFKTE
ncbi:hypothetical protein VNI00_011725 [Paramarasmius palmivorus]|uniref:J domain-containing protein n=1 Tax=Paramarasmius palmivorus TaxID=297713 RepID=A0AAW0CC96_9AGAR